MEVVKVSQSSKLESLPKEKVVSAQKRENSKHFGNLVLKAATKVQSKEDATINSKTEKKEKATDKVENLKDLKNLIDDIISIDDTKVDLSQNAIDVLSMLSMLINNLQTGKQDPIAVKDNILSNIRTKLNLSDTNFAKLSHIIDKIANVQAASRQVANINDINVTTTNSKVANIKDIELIATKGQVVNIEDVSITAIKSQVTDINDVNAKVATSQVSDINDINVKATNSQVANIKDVNVTATENQVANIKDVNAKVATSQVTDINDINVKATESQVTNIKDVNVTATNSQVANIKDVEVKATEGQVTNIKDVEVTATNSQVTNIKNVDIKTADIQVANIKDVNVKTAESQVASSNKISLTEIKQEIFSLLSSIENSTYKDNTKNDYANLKQVLPEIKQILALNAKNNQNTNANANTDKKEEKFLNSLVSVDKKEDTNLISTNLMNKFTTINNNEVNNLKEPEVINQKTIVNDVIRTLKFMGTNDIKNMTVKITPKELGEITINLTVEAGVMKATITAANKDAYTLIQGNLQDMSSKLVNNDIKISTLSLNMYNEDTTYYSGQFNGNNSNDQKNKEHKNISKIHLEEQEAFDLNYGLDSNVNKLA